ncbi:hypothetical protein KY285_025504 [Solanum tuberosum]|nr:hypothetical protein KY289_024270 [Solanum tuberosum]KAH0677703.1 hypothetical protein KY285_025504 [Solanum tuberosum]
MERTLACKIGEGQSQSNRSKSFLRQTLGVLAYTGFYKSGELFREHIRNSTSFSMARSTRNAANRAKLKMLHHIGRKDGNPLDLTTIFFETHNKDNKLVEPEAIKKNAQLEEMVQEDSSRPTIDIVNVVDLILITTYLDLGWSKGKRLERWNFFKS